MTNQETFDIVVTALRAQGRKSVDAHGGCMYRGPNGLKCAAGHLIPDSLYSPEMEHKIASNHTKMLIELGHDPWFVNALQAAHDNAESDDFVNRFLARARLLALKYGLSDAATR